MVNITQLQKGSVTILGTDLASTTTSGMLEMKGHNAVLLHVVVTGTGAWTFKVQGATVANGTYVDCYDNLGSAMSTGSISASRCQLFVGLPEYIKVVSTEDSGTATVVVKAIPITV